MNPIAQVIFKRTPDIKNYLFVFPDKSIVVRSLILLNKVEKVSGGDKIIARKFGKILIQRKDLHVSQETIGAMNYLANVYDFNIQEGFIQTGKMGRL